MIILNNSFFNGFDNKKFKTNKKIWPNKFVFNTLASDKFYLLAFSPNHLAIKAKNNSYYRYK